MVLLLFRARYIIFFYITVLLIIYYCTARLSKKLFSACVSTGPMKPFKISIFLAAQKQDYYKGNTINIIIGIT